jgi:hypothetical protein
MGRFMRCRLGMGGGMRMCGEWRRERKRKRGSMSEFFGVGGVKDLGN